MNFRDAQLLSAYLDGQLVANEAARLEARLAVDAGLRQLLDDLRIARGLLKRTPRLKAPRNFTLRATDVRVRAPRPLAVPLLRYAGALASVLFLVSVATNTLAPVMARNVASAPLAYGLGGGGGGGGGDAGEPVVPPAPMAIAPQSPLAESAPAAPQDSAAPTAEAFAKAAPPEQPAGASPDRQQALAPVPMVWLLAFAVLAVLAVGLSFYLDHLTRREFRSRVLEK